MTQRSCRLGDSLTIRRCRHLNHVVSEDSMRVKTTQARIIGETTAKPIYAHTCNMYMYMYWNIYPGHDYGMCRART